MTETTAVPLEIPDEAGIDHTPLAVTKRAWSDRHGEALTDDEAAYLTRENVEPGYMDFSSRTVLHAYRAGRTAASELSPEEDR